MKIRQPIPCMKHPIPSHFAVWPLPPKYPTKITTRVSVISYMEVIKPAAVLEKLYRLSTVDRTVDTKPAVHTE